MAAQIFRNAAPHHAADGRADRLGHSHQRMAERHDPGELEAELRAGPAVGRDPAMTAMGDETANMIQPFRALPILAIAQLGIKDIMGYGVIALVIGPMLYGGALLVFA